MRLSDRLTTKFSELSLRSDGCDLSAFSFALRTSDKEKRHMSAKEKERRPGIEQREESNGKGRKTS
jgi:hypothetical protein